MNIWKFITNKLLIVLASLLLTSCISTNYEIYIDDDDNRQNMGRTQDSLVKSALRATKKGYPETFVFNNRSFTNDCSGLIYGIFWDAGIDLISLISNESGNGVKRIHSLLNKKRLLHSKKLPNPGDLIFWNNTYGKFGQNPLSHIGIVVSVDKSTGQIDYVHNNTYLGEVRRETMNLYKPHENRPVNNYMRYDNKYKKTAAELFDSFGMAWKL